MNNYQPSPVTSAARNGGRPNATRPVRFMAPMEIAKILRVSRMTVYRAIHDGSLRAITVGRSFRVLESEFDRYLKDQQWVPSPIEADGEWIEVDPE